MADGVIRDEHGLRAVLGPDDDWVDVRSFRQQPFGRGTAEASIEISLRGEDGWCGRWTREELGADRFARVAADYASVRAFAIEQRILAGENDFTIGSVRYTVPQWYREPIKRVCVEWARWKARR